MKIETILVPTDFSEHAERALDVAIEFAKAWHSKIVLLHAYDLKNWVSPYEVIFSEDLAGEIQEAAKARLAAWVDRVSEEGVEVSTEIVFDAPSTGIVERASRDRADLIVMGTRGLSKLKQVLLGSVAARTIRGAPCPVLTVPLDAMETDG